MLPQKDHMGSGCWEHQRCSVWGRRGGMLHIGCECWDGASPHSHNSQMPLYSVPPPFIPPPLSSSSNKWSFCSSVFAAVGWQAPSRTKTPRLLDSPEPFFSHVLCNLRPPTYFFFLIILLFIPAFIFPLDSLHSSHLLLVLAPLLAWWIFEIPSLPSVHYMHYCSTIFFSFAEDVLCLSASPLTLRFSTVL